MIGPYVTPILVACPQCGADTGEQRRGVWAFLSGRPHVERLITASGVRIGDEP